MAKTKLGKTIVELVNTAEALEASAKKLKKQVEELIKKVEPPDQPAQT